VLYTSIDLRRLREAVAAQQHAAPRGRADGWGDIVPPVTDGLSRRRRKQRNRARWAGRRSAADGIELDIDLIGSHSNFGSYTDAAVAFLVDLLYVTPVRSTEAKAAWRAAGFRDIAIRRAQRRLGIKPYQVGFHGGWWWALPDLDGDRDPDPENYLALGYRQSPGHGSTRSGP
jgi:hypothetical protein